MPLTPRQITKLDQIHDRIVLSVISNFNVTKNTGWVSGAWLTFSPTIDLSVYSFMCLSGRGPSMTLGGGGLTAGVNTTLTITMDTRLELNLADASSVYLQGAAGLHSSAHSSGPASITNTSSSTNAPQFLYSLAGITSPLYRLRVQGMATTMGETGGGTTITCSVPTGNIYLFYGGLEQALTA